jgi:hypothetical protein
MINFQRYLRELEKIVEARLVSAKDGLEERASKIIALDASKLASMTVSRITRA